MGFPRERTSWSERERLEDSRRGLLLPDADPEKTKKRASNVEKPHQLYLAFD